jgi:hypothetical protein
MPRTVQDILDHADDLARRFEDYEARPADGRDPAVYLALRQAALDRSEAERAVRDAVIAARRHGYSWQAIGAILGTSGEAARQRYGAVGDTGEARSA